MKKNLYPPVKLKGTGSAVPLNFEIHIPSAQIKSAIMLSALNTNGIVKIKELKTTRDHTEKMLLQNNHVIKVEDRKKKLIKVFGKKSLKPINIEVPNDPSSAAFFSALTLLKENSS